MIESIFRYIATSRLPAWEAAGWRAVSPYLEFQHLAHIEGFGGQDISHVLIVEWHGEGEPIEPELPLNKLITR